MSVKSRDMSLILVSLSLSDLIVCNVPVDDYPGSFAAPLEKFLLSSEVLLGRAELMGLRPIATAEADCFFSLFSYAFRLASDTFALLFQMVAAAF